MRHIISILFLFITCKCFCQTFTGCVTDTNGKALETVSVILADNNKKNIAFVKTAKDGTFVIKQPEGKKAETIIIVRIGYAKKYISVSDFKNGQNIELYEKTVEIKEVTVTPDRMWQKGDTLVYSVAGFREKQDRTIEDVVAHMPGLSVSSEGVIMFKDKPINRFYVEGRETVGDRYAMISKNLSADKVKNVEILQNHQPIKALRNKVFSNDAALNLVLTDHAKESWTGSAGTGTGATLQNTAKWLRDGNISGMLLGGDIQNVSIYKSNNTGKNIENDIKSKNGDGLAEPGLLSNIRISTPGINFKRANFNDSHIAATNLFIKTGTESGLRLQFSGLYDKSKGENHVITQYKDISGTKLQEEISTSQTYRRQWGGNVEYNSNTSKFLINNKLYGELNYNESTALTMLNGRQTNQHAKPRQHNVGNRFRALRITGNGKLFMQSDFNYSYLPGTLLLYNGTEERLDINSILFNLSARYSHSFNKINISLDSGIETDVKKENVAYSDTTGCAKYKSFITYIEPGIYYNSDKLHFSLSAMLQFTRQSIGSTKECFFSALPNFNLTWSPNKRFNTDISYTYNVSPASFYSINPLRVYISYNMPITGNGIFDRNSSHTASISLGYSHLHTGIISKLNYSFTLLNTGYMYAASLNDGVYNREMTAIDNSTRNNGIKYSIEKSFRRKGNKISLDCGFEWSNYNMLTDGVKTQNKFHSYSAGMSWSTLFLKFVSLKGSSYYIGSMYKSSMSKKETTHYFNHNISLILTSGQWVARLDGQCSHGNDDNTSFCIFSDASLSYRTKKYEISVECNNMSGKDTFRCRYITSYSSTLSVFKLRPREAVAKITFNF